MTRCHVKPAERPHKDVRAGLTSQGRRRTSLVYHSDRPKGCEFTMTYAVERWWDFKPYMGEAGCIFDATECRVEPAERPATDGRAGLTS